MADKKQSKIKRIWQAMGKLAADKEDTTQVFIILNALGESAGRRSFKRFLRLPQSAAILAAERPLLDYLQDRDWLKSLPEGSLGRNYHDFTEREQITADGLAAASEEGAIEAYDFSEQRMRYHQRQRDAHDLWHVATGYGRDGLGELALLAFTWRQVGNPGFLVIIGLGIFTMRKYAPLRELLRVVGEGFRLGRRAAWMAAADWEHLLTRPLDEVRATLHLTPADAYHTLLKHRPELASDDLSIA